MPALMAALVGAAMESLVKIDQAIFEPLRVRVPRYPVHAWACLALSL